MTTTERWYVKKDGDTRNYALCYTQADAELLARNLSSRTGEVFYAKKVEPSR
jgi:hypothetical protein